MDLSLAGMPCAGSGTRAFYLLFFSSFLHSTRLGGPDASFKRAWGAGGGHGRSAASGQRPLRRVRGARALNKGSNSSSRRHGPQCSSGSHDPGRSKARGTSRVIRADCKVDRYRGPWGDGNRAPPHPPKAVRKSSSMRRASFRDARDHDPSLSPSGVYPVPEDKPQQRRRKRVDRTRSEAGLTPAEHSFWGAAGPGH